MTISLTLKPTHRDFHQALLTQLPNNQIYTDPLSRLAYGTDASFYRYIPEIVVRAHNENQIAIIMALANQYKIAITFRASGTSLSGQASSDSVLVLMGDGFLGKEILNQGEKIKLQPMVIGSHANQALAPYARKIGPDPASINTARIGGIFANNSGGMCCGTVDNSYHTLDSVRLILTDGTILDTANPESIIKFRQSHRSLLDKISALSERIRANPELEAKVRRKYRIKNTTGYGINALIDYTDPVEMLTHLMVGSEGTLGFVSEVTFRTVPDHEHKASALVFFNNLDTCCLTVTALKKAGNASAVELLDARSMRCVAANKPGLPEFIYTNFGDDAACLLIETRAATVAELNANIQKIDAVINHFEGVTHSQFSSDSVTCDLYWSVRKGLLPIVGAGRAIGSSLLTEDITFPIEHLAAGVRGLTALLVKYHYDEAVILGHAFDGNMHFIMAPLLNTPELIERYNQFMHALTELVAVQFEGSMKGEHGTGRNVAPFVQTEWGDAAYLIMREIKTLFDPLNILNPDVIITDDPELHIKNLKPLPAADEIIDKCIECGFCEPACPSNGLSLTPRQRITIWRRIQELRRLNEPNEELAYYEKHYPYQGIDTCALTGMCATRCPVGINTGELMKKLKLEFAGATGKSPNTALPAFAQKNMKWMTAGARLAFKTSQIFGTRRTHQLTTQLHKTFKSIPIIPAQMPKALSGNAMTRALAVHQDLTKQPIVYFVSCVNRVISDHVGSSHSIANHTLSLFDKAGFRAIYPDNMAGLCCGQPFESAGNSDIANRASNALNAALLRASNQGEYPVYLDNSPCALRIIEAQQQGLVDARLKLHDAVSFLAKYIAPKLTLNKKIDSLMVHIPCSATKMGVGSHLLNLAKACSQQVISPDIACCGFAGNKGFAIPELNTNGLRNLKSEIPKGCQHGVSMSNTCQIGLTNHSGVPYQSIEALLNECSE